MSNMEIKKGMYVRTKKGIAKYLGLGIDVLKDDGSSSYNHWKNKHIFNNCIFDEEYGDTLTTLMSLDEKIVGYPSYDVADLIQAGDYVNESRVMKINKETGTIFLELGHITKEYYDKIYSIVTKEQFEKISYKVGD